MSGRCLGLVFYLLAVIAAPPVQAAQPQPATAARVEALARAARFPEAIAMAERRVSQALARRPSRPAEAVAALGQLAEIHIQLARYADAEAKGREALALAEKAFGKDDPRLAAPLNILGTVALGRDRHAEAESLFTRALALREAAGMREHPDVADSALGLSRVHFDRGDNDTAEAYARRALVIRETARKSDPVELATAAASLGNIRRNLNDPDEADVLIRRALSLRERHLAADHPHIAASLSQLAGVHQIRNQLAEAEPLFQRALDIYRRTLGADNLSTGWAHYNLAALRQAQKRMPEAEELYRQALAIFEHAAGERSGGTMNTLLQLARIHDAANRSDEAERAYARALPVYGEIYGETGILSGLISDYAQVLLVQGKQREAAAQYERALAIGDKLPNNDALLYRPLIALTTLYWIRGLHDQAEVVAKRALDVTGRLYNADAAQIVDLRAQLAQVYQGQGRLAEADALMREVLDQTVRLFGEVSQKSEAVLRKLAFISTMDHRLADTDAHLQRLLAIQLKLYKPDDVRIGKTYVELAHQRIRRALYSDAETELSRARAIADASGDGDLLESCLSVEGLLRSKTGAYVRAAELMRQVAEAHEERHGPRAQGLGAYYNNLAGVLTYLGKYEDAVVAYKRAIEVNQIYFEPVHRTLGLNMANLAGVYRQMWRLDEAAELLRRAGESFARVPSLQALIMEHQAQLESAYGRYRNAVEIQRKVVKDVEAADGPDHPDLATSLHNLGSFLIEVGDYQDADDVLARALSIVDKHFGPGHLHSTEILTAIGLLRGEQGRTAEVEAPYRRVISIYEAALGAEHPDTARAYSNYAVHLIETGRAAEADPLLRRARAVFAAQLGPEHRFTQLAISNLAFGLDKQGRRAEAEALYREAITLGEKVLGPEHPEMVWNLNNLGGFYMADKRYAEAVALHERAVRIAEKGLPDDNPNKAQTLSHLGGALVEVGRLDEAAPLLQRALATREQRLGLAHPYVAKTLVHIAKLREKREGLRSVYPITKRATGIFLDDLRRQSGPQTAMWQADGRVSLDDQAGAFIHHGRAAFWLAGQEPDRAAALRDEAFTLAQWAHQSAAAAALSQTTARFAKGENELADLVRKRQDLVWRYQALDKLLLTQTAKPAAARDAAAEQALRDEAQAIDKTLREIDERLSREFPDYAALVNPEPLSLAATQALLHDNEALYQLLIGDTATLAFLVTKGEARWLELPVGKQALADQVEALRCGLDSSFWWRETPEQRARSERCWQALQHAPSGRGILPFDLERAHALYKTLLGPFADLIEGKHLLIVPSGPLTALPPHVLVAQPVKPEARFSDYAAATWLGKDHAVTVLPSVASLQASRGTPKGASAPNPFVSFANPLLTGETGTDRTAWERQSCAAIGAAAERTHRAAGPGDIAAVYTGASVNLEHLRRQTPLPDTANEACAVGRSLGAEEADIHLGARATETELKALNGKDGKLRSYRILHFATHGLVASETKDFIKTQAEPSLMLTPPDKATDEDDGLLTASEVAGLSLNAETAVLSACNTASASGAYNAEALSGLARAFFYAGARALLVTHWYVADDAAVALVTNSFAERRQHPDIALAEALRRAMAAGIAAGGDKAHPAWWAPFVVVTAD